MAVDTTPTTITVPTYVRKMLDAYRTQGQTYTDVLLRFIEEIPTKRFLEELDRISAEEEFVDLEVLEKEPGFY